MAKKIFIIITSILFLLVSNVHAQISPGELCKAHASLEGISNCTKCHDVGNKVTRAKCLDCHKEIKANIASKKGYHANAEVVNRNCAECHNDHHGRNFQIIRFDKKTFNHNKTGFELKGKHAQQTCVACHKPANIKNPVTRKKTGTYLGLNQDCLTCHADYHQGKLSSKCSNCHSFNSFKNATGFDHSTTRFPLFGKHKRVACVDCHKTETINGKSTQKFKGLQFANCTACHTDVHENKFGQNCKQCHTEESFHQVKGMSNFNHDNTDFKLVGKHKLVACKQCHVTSLTAKLKHDKCSDCHSDYHKREFAKNGVSPDCNTCHTNESFSPSTFTIERHNQTKFKLVGAHSATSCNQCHKKQKDWTFRNMGNKCVDCHKNEHKGFIPEKYYPGENCIACHNEENWKTVKFDHNTTSFKLEGAHKNVSCNACHYRKNESGIRTQKFEGTSKECSSCHKDNHMDQFAVNGKTNCTRCHDFGAWSKSKFDHNTSRFKIDGQHKFVKCEECHKPVTNTKGKYIEYKFNNIECSKCHG